MERDELRERLLSQHKHLRQLIAGVHARAAQVRKGGSTQEVEALRLQLFHLHDAAVLHVAFEDAMLRPMLSAMDVWGPERAAVLEQEHVAEHSLLLKALHEAAQEGSPERLVGTAVAAVEELVAHMAEEERTVINADVISDTCVTTGQATS